jgi:hypothetical protein
MGYIWFLLGAIIGLLVMIGWTLDRTLGRISDSLKSIDSRLKGLNNVEENVEENLELLIKLKTGQTRFNGEHFEDVRLWCHGKVKPPVGRFQDKPERWITLCRRAGPFGRPCGQAE